MTERAKVYGPPKIAPDTALRLKVDERDLVDRTYTVRRDLLFTTFRYFRCRWCGRLVHIQQTDSSRYSARDLVSHALRHEVDEQP